MNIISASLLILLPSVFASPVVDLGSSSCFAILSTDALVNLGSQGGISQFFGNVGTSAYYALYGFDLFSDGSVEFSSSSMVPLGNVYSSSHSAPTPGILDAAVDDMEAAYTYASGLPHKHITIGDHNFKPNNVTNVGVNKFTGHVTLLPDHKLVFDGDDDAGG